MRRYSRIQAAFTLFFIASSLLTLQAQSPRNEGPHASGGDSEEAIAEVVNFSSTHAQGVLYFKSNLQGLKKDVHLILEKENGEGELEVVDSRDGVGTDKEIPILYSFKDEAPDHHDRVYRLRAIWFDEDGDHQDHVLAEKRFRNALLSQNEE